MNFNGQKLGMLMPNITLQWTFKREKVIQKIIIKLKRWFEIASKQGDASAQNALGIIYLRGWGDKDLSKAEYYYRLAANKNHENAQLQLALILLNSKK